jgi:hypothetical protein
MKTIQVFLQIEFGSSITKQDSFDILDTIVHALVPKFDPIGIWGQTDFGGWPDQARAILEKEVLKPAVEPPRFCTHFQKNAKAGWHICERPLGHAGIHQCDCGHEWTG